MGRLQSAICHLQSAISHTPAAMRAAILGSGPGWHVEQLLRAFEARGHACVQLPISALAARVGLDEGSRLASRGQALDDFDCVLVRIIPRGSLEQIIFRVDALHLLAARGVRVVNPARAIERTVDKYFTSGLLAQAGLPTPRTIVCERADDAQQAFEALGGDVVVKPLFGSMGQGLVRVQDPDVAYRVFKALDLAREVFYVQQALPHLGRDLRAFVLGGRVLAAMERVGEGWRTNIARGATARAIRLTPQQESLCLKAAEVAGAEYAGVDLLPAADGCDYLLEVNGIPGWQGLQTTTEVDIAGEIAAYLEGSLSADRGPASR
jgi:RimK family alpha-L-glutamate ligase